jgi:site-specific DNA-methyltransferase (adenine-specific)
MIFADPPYNLSNGSTACHAGKRVSVNKALWNARRGIEDDFSFHNVNLGLIIHFFDFWRLMM